MNKASSFNGKLILEAYTHTEVKAEIRSGWATVTQKTNLKGLKLLVDAKDPSGETIPAGSTAFIREDFLHTSPWAKNKFKSDTLPGEFIVCTLNDVEFINPPAGDAA